MALTSKKIIATMQRLHGMAGAQQYALTGGALFQLAFGAAVYQTHDIDVIGVTMLSLPTVRGYASDDHNRYIVDGVQVDWLLPERAATSLYYNALQHATLHEAGFWMLSVEWAAVIKLSAGRSKDNATINKLEKAGHLNSNLINELCLFYRRQECV